MTGFPAFTAKRMIGKLLAAEPETKLYVLARDKFAPEADQLLDTLGAGDRAEVLVGDVCDMDLGLSSAEYRALSKELSWIHHLAGIYFMGVDDDTARRVNVGGTRTILELARDAARLERVVHWSTAMVAGDRRAPCYEGDLDDRPALPQRLRAHQVRGRAPGPRRRCASFRSRCSGLPSSSATAAPARSTSSTGPTTSWS